MIDLHAHIHTIRKYLSWLAVVLWMAVIFALSSQVAEQSNRLSTGVTEIIVKTIEKVVPGVNFDIGSLNHIVRKNAHFFAYLVLGILMMNAFGRSGMRGRKRAALTLLVCVLYAISDEVHQLFVPERGAQVRDILIDSTGAGVGLGLYLLFSRISRRKKKALI